MVGKLQPFRQVLVRDQHADRVGHPSAQLCYAECSPDELILEAYTDLEASEAYGVNKTKTRRPPGAPSFTVFGLYDEWMSEQCSRSVKVECYAGHPGEQTPRTLILGDRRIAVAQMVDAWLAPDYRYFKLRGADGDTHLVRHDERSSTWELTMFRAERVGER